MVLSLSFIGVLYMQSKQIVRLAVNVKSQKLELMHDGSILKSFVISTSKFGTGSEMGSKKTPLGHFRIAEKIGDGAPAGEIFVSRVPTGKFGKDGDPADYVQTRILWLEGLDTDNTNTHERYIYIHGTNSESKLGSPASYGCVRMSNADVIDLYNRVDVGTLVDIYE
jgi:L,D-transpeptidase YbiS